MPAGYIQNYRNPIRYVHGIFVGINKYEINQDPKKMEGRMGGHIPDLNGCVNDATDLAEAFEADHKELILDAQATRLGIFGCISDFIHQKNLSRPLPNNTGLPAAQVSRDVSLSTEKIDYGDWASLPGQLNGYLLVISISAHGLILSETDEFCIAPYDFNPENRLGTAFSTITLINAMSSLVRLGARVLLIMDACHAGGFPFDLSKYSSLFSRGGIACISSCSASESSLENNSADRPSGIFTHFLVKGLQGQAMDENHIITLRSLYDFTRKEVTKISPNQHPTLIGTLDGNTILKKINPLTWQPERSTPPSLASTTTS